MGKEQQMIIKFQLPVKMVMDDGWYILSFLPLNAHGQGRTEGDAVRSFKQAFQAVVEICLEDGTLENILRDAGVHIASSINTRKSVSEPHHRKNDSNCKWRNITVPIPMAMSNASC